MERDMKLVESLSKKNSAVSEAVQRQAGCKIHCWHLIGKRRRNHGPHVPKGSYIAEPPVSACCWCNALDSFGAPVPPHEVIDDNGNPVFPVSAKAS